MAKWVELKSAQEVRDAQSIAWAFYRDVRAASLGEYSIALGPDNRVSDAWFEQDRKNGWSYRILVEDEE